MTNEINMNSKRKGNITELSVALAFQKLNIPVAIPFGDCERYDLIVDINNKLYKIQCKTASPYRGDSTRISFNCRSISISHGKNVHHRYTKDEIDFFATVWDNKCYLVPVTETSTEKILSLIPPKNNQRVGVNMAEDYLLEKVVKEL